MPRGITGIYFTHGSAQVCFVFSPALLTKKERIFQNDSSRVVNLLQGSLAFFFLPLVYI